MLSMLLLAALTVLTCTAQQQLSIPADGGVTVNAIEWGAGERGVVLAHGGRFKKESWEKQAGALAAAGFRVVAIDFRPAEAGREFDVLAAVRYLRKTRAKTVSVVGASMGGDYAADAAEAAPGEIDRLVLLAAGAYTTITKMTGPKLFIIARDDVMGENTPRLPKIRDQFQKASGPKEMVLLEGSAHAQFLFATDQGDRLMKEILRFLTAPRPEL
jgi:acetyl esterase/lipase